MAGKISMVIIKIDYFTAITLKKKTKQNTEAAQLLFLWALYQKYIQ